MKCLSPLGIPYCACLACTDDEWKNLSNVILNSDKDWDHTFLACETNIDNETWFDAQSSFLDGPDNKTFIKVKTTGIELT